MKTKVLHDFYRTATVVAIILEVGAKLLAGKRASRAKDHVLWLVHFFIANQRPSYVQKNKSGTCATPSGYTVEEMANFVSRELCFALLFLSLAKTFCFKPVIIVHGILDHASDMKDLASFITKAHPGTNITLISLFEEVDSFKPMWMQVSAMREKIRPVMQEAKDGVHIIGFSQGIS